MLFCPAKMTLNSNATFNPGAHTGNMGFEFRSGRNEHTPDFSGEEKGLMDGSEGQLEGTGE